jgi:hypothetical protein
MEFLMKKLYLILLVLMGFSVSTLSYSSTYDHVSSSDNAASNEVQIEPSESKNENQSEWANTLIHSDIFASNYSRESSKQGWTGNGESGHSSGNHTSNDELTAVPLPQTWVLLMVGCAILFGRREKASQDSILIAV